MLGAVVFRLRAKCTSIIPRYHGRLLHAAVFNLLREYSPELSAEIHDGEQLKPFSLSLLEKVGRKSYSIGDYNNENQGSIKVHKDEEFLFRIGILNSTVLNAMLYVSVGTEIIVGKAVFVIDQVICDGSHESGASEDEDILAGIFSMDTFRKVTFDFVTPTAFRKDNDDFTLPVPEMLFNTLVDKWQKYSMPLDISRDEIKAIAAEICIESWCGKSRTVYLGKQRGVQTFTGRFTYDLSRLPDEWRKVFMLLAQFAVFSGVGRLTSQGFGRVRINWG